MKYWHKLKEKWHIETDRRMAWIFLIFAITGSSTLFVRKFIYGQLGIDIQNQWLAFFVKLIAIYIIYQILLLFIGTVMGEGKFFRWFLTKMNRRMLGRKMENGSN